MGPLLESILSPAFGFAIFRVMTPILFPAIGVAISSLAGSINIAMEGTMLIAAFTGVMVSYFTQNLYLALIAGVLSGVLMGFILGYFHLKLKADIILSAIALNMFASGFTIFMLFIIAQNKGTSIALNSLVFPKVHLPFIQDIPILGEILSGHNVLTYVAVISVIFIYYLIFKTPLGLQIRAVGQNPDAAASVGIDVNRIKLYSLLISGFFGALGGLYLSMGYVTWFGRDMTAGRGFIAVAASNLGGHLPLGVFISSLFFGLINATAIYLAPLRIPSEFVQLIPYVATVIALTIYSIQIARKRPKKRVS